MRTIFAAIIMLSGSTAVVHAAPAQRQAQIQPGYGYYMHMRAPVGRSPTEDDKKIEKDNEELDLPPTQDDVIGAEQVQSEENVVAKRIEQENARHPELRGVCGGC